jgi:predicted nucleic acid-binding protein
MKIFLDTNVLIAAFLSDHVHHNRAAPLVQSVIAGTADGFVSGHSLLETHAVMTGMARQPRITPAACATLIRENVLEQFSIVALAAHEYSRLIQRIGRDDISGGRTYDMLHAACAVKAGVDRVYTFNTRDFLTFSPELSGKVQTP